MDEQTSIYVCLKIRKHEHSTGGKESLESEQQDDEGNEEDEHHVDGDSRLAGGRHLEGVEFLESLLRRDLDHDGLLLREGQGEHALGGVAAGVQRGTHVVDRALQVQVEVQEVQLDGVVRSEDEVVVVRLVDLEGPLAVAGEVHSVHAVAAVDEGREVHRQDGVLALLQELLAA